MRRTHILIGTVALLPILYGGLQLSLRAQITPRYDAVCIGRGIAAPSHVAPGEYFNAYAQFRNAGTDSWNYVWNQVAIFHARPSGGAEPWPWGPAPNARVYDPAGTGLSTPPGQTGMMKYFARAQAVTADVTWPLGLRMWRTGTGEFGERCAGDIRVKAVPSRRATITVEVPPPATVTAGQAYQVGYRVSNTGNVSWVSTDDYADDHPAVRNTDYNFSRIDPSNPAVPAEQWQAEPPYAGNSPDSWHVNPGDSRLFFVRFTAPATSGPFTLPRWRMRREGLGWFGEPTPAITVNVTGGTQTSTEPPPPTPPPPQSSGLALDMGIFVTNPVFAKGEARETTLTIRNGSSLVHVPGGTVVEVEIRHPTSNVLMTDVASSAPLESPLAPGGTVPVSVTVHAPGISGEYSVTARLRVPPSTNPAHASILNGLRGHGTLTVAPGPSVAMTGRAVIPEELLGIHAPSVAVSGNVRVINTGPVAMSGGATLRFRYGVMVENGPSVPVDQSQITYILGSARLPSAIAPGSEASIPIALTLPSAGTFSVRAELVTFRNSVAGPVVNELVPLADFLTSASRYQVTVSVDQTTASPGTVLRYAADAQGPLTARMWVGIAAPGPNDAWQLMEQADPQCSVDGQGRLACSTADPVLSGSRARFSGILLRVRPDARCGAMIRPRMYFQAIGVERSVLIRPPAVTVEGGGCLPPGSASSASAAPAASSAAATWPSVAVTVEPADPVVSRNPGHAARAALYRVTIRNTGSQPIITPAVPLRLTLERRQSDAWEPALSLNRDPACAAESRGIACTRTSRLDPQATVTFGPIPLAPAGTPPCGTQIAPRYVVTLGSWDIATGSLPAMRVAADCGTGSAGSAASSSAAASVPAASSAASADVPLLRQVHLASLTPPDAEGNGIAQFQNIGQEALNAADFFVHPQDPFGAPTLTSRPPMQSGSVPVGSTVLVGFRAHRMSAAPGTYQIPARVLYRGQPIPGGTFTVPVTFGSASSSAAPSSSSAPPADPARTTYLTLSFWVNGCTAATCALRVTGPMDAAETAFRFLVTDLTTGEERRVESPDYVWPRGLVTWRPFTVTVPFTVPAGTSRQFRLRLDHPAYGTHPSASRDVTLTNAEDRLWSQVELLHPGPYHALNGGTFLFLIRNTGTVPLPADAGLYLTFPGAPDAGQITTPIGQTIPAGDEGILRVPFVALSYPGRWTATRIRTIVLQQQVGTRLAISDATERDIQVAGVNAGDAPVAPLPQVRLSWLNPHVLEAFSQEQIALQVMNLQDTPLPAQTRLRVTPPDGSSALEGSIGTDVPAGGSVTLRITVPTGRPGQRTVRAEVPTMITIGGEIPVEITDAQPDTGGVQYVSDTIGDYLPLNDRPELGSITFRNSGTTALPANTEFIGEAADDGQVFARGVTTYPLAPGETGRVSMLTTGFLPERWRETLDFRLARARSALLRRTIEKGTDISRIAVQSHSLPSQLHSPTPVTATLTIRNDGRTMNARQAIQLAVRQPPAGLVFQTAVPDRLLQTGQTITVPVTIGSYRDGEYTLVMQNGRSSLPPNYELLRHTIRQDTILDARFVSTNLPESMEANATRLFDLTVQNTGTACWNAGEVSIVPLEGTANLIAPSRINRNVCGGPRNMEGPNFQHNYTFSPLLRAPVRTGTYPVKLRLERNGEPLGPPLILDRTLTVTPATGTTSTPPPGYSLVYEEHTLPPTLKAGQRTTFFLTVRNTGIQTISPQSTGFQQTIASQMPVTGYFPSEIEPGETVRIMALLTPPSTPGSYVLEGRMYLIGGAEFGPPFRQSVTVEP